jgi:hypothetical protein
MMFADGLDYWELAGDFPGDGQPHWQDYSCTVADRSAVLAAAVLEPPGFAVLVQTIDADDYLGRTVTFRGQLRTAGVAGRAGLHLAAGAAVEPPGAHLRDHGASSLTGSASSLTGPASSLTGSASSLTGSASSLTGPGSSDWTWHEVTMPVPGYVGVIRFGISLTGRGRVELRNAELTAARPGTQE